MDPQAHVLSLCFPTLLPHGPWPGWDPRWNHLASHISAPSGFLLVTSFVCQAPGKREWSLGLRPGSFPLGAQSQMQTTSRGWKELGCGQGRCGEAAEEWETEAGSERPLLAAQECGFPVKEGLAHGLGDSLGAWL